MPHFETCRRWLTNALERELLSAATDGNLNMPKIDQAALDSLEKREFQLTILAAVFVMVLAGGVALLMYPLVFLHPEEGSKWMLRTGFAGFCVLTILFVVYLFDRQRTVRKLKQHLMEEMERNAELRNQANVDLLHSLADLNHFQDQLSMEFRRAMNTTKSLSLIAVKVNVSSTVTGDKEIAAALSDAVKGISRNLRVTDSTYLLAPALFGVVMPETSSSNAKLIEMKLEQTLRSIGAPNRFGVEITTCSYPEQVQSAHEMQDVISDLLPEKQVWEDVASSR
jgi:GGDEF domain-containing protein